MGQEVEMMTETSVDEFGRVNVSREDRDTLTSEWNAKYGQPMNSLDLTLRDQWVVGEAIWRKLGMGIKA